MAHARTIELREHLATQRGVLQAAWLAVPVPLRTARPDPARWSAADVLAHLALVERQVAALLRRGLRAASPPPLDAAAAATSVRGRFDLDAVLDRARRLEAPPGARPPAPPPGVAASADADPWQELQATRAALLAVVDAADGLDVACIRAPHPLLGELDFWQWVLFVGGHEGRHAAQVRELATQLAAGAG